LSRLAARFSCRVRPGFLRLSRWMDLLPMVILSGGLLDLRPGGHSDHGVEQRTHIDDGDIDGRVGTAMGNGALVVVYQGAAGVDDVGT
jgi:hypothetical protein